MDQHGSDGPYDVEHALDAFYDELAEITSFDSHAMVAAWGAIEPAERTTAWQLVREETKSTGREDLLDEARESVLRWSRGIGLEGSAYSLTQGDDLSSAEARNQALPPVLDAAAAVILRDRLPAEAFDVLYAPWAAAAEAEPDEGEDDADAEVDEDEDEFDDS